jgi:hypothetical protein
MNNDRYILLEGDCLDVLKGYEECAFDSVVTDSPYGIQFMGKGWDREVPGPAYWNAIFRVAKPGAFLLAFGGTRTFHRLDCAIEDAGWIIADHIGWIFGGGKPASRNRLKPAWNPITVACKGISALNIEACRVGKRWPPNIIHDGGDEAMAIFPDNTGQAAPLARRSADKHRHVFGAFKGTEDEGFEPHDGLGSAARFFYCARASASERGKGNDHPNVKPIELMRYLVRLATPEGGIVLDPFMGSGSTGLAALREGFSFVGIDSDPHSVEIARSRFEKEE